MQQGDGSRYRIDEVDRCTIRDIDREQLPRHICHQAIDSGVLEDGLIRSFRDDRNPIPMNLLGMVAGGNFRKSVLNPAIMVGREIS
jgi:hypothetical protein